MTLADMITATRDWIDEPTPQNFTDALITRFLNDAQQIVAAEIVHEYEDYFEIQADLNPSNTPPGTVVGQELYVLPTDFLKFKRIERSDTGETLPALDLNEKVSIGGGLVPLTIGGVSLSYYVTGNNVGFTPTPTAAIPIRMTYIQRLTDLAVSTDISPIPSEHHHLLPIWAAIGCFVKDESDITNFQTLWQEGLDRIRRTLRQRQIQQPKKVRRVSSNYGVLM
jgi:hypothetical protein